MQNDPIVFGASGATRAKRRLLQIKVGHNRHPTNGMNVTYLRSSRAQRKNKAFCPHGPNWRLKVPYSKRFVLSLKLHPLSLGEKKKEKTNRRILGEQSSSKLSRQLCTSFSLFSGASSGKTPPRRTKQQQQWLRSSDPPPRLVQGPAYGLIQPPRRSSVNPRLSWALGLSGGAEPPPGWWAVQELQTKASDATPRLPHLVSRP